MSSVSCDYPDPEYTPLPRTMSRSEPTPSLTSALPPDHIVRTFSRLKNLQVEAKKILDSLNENGDGNQWIVVLNLSPGTIQKLDEEHDTSLGGISYRFQWEGTTGLIKVVPGEAHDAITDNFTRIITANLLAMGQSIWDPQWVGTTTYKPSTGAGKQGDQAFKPPTRCSPGLPGIGWPTLVVETGVSESLPRLREDAKKWFRDSRGDVRIVILISIKRTMVTFEKWQLAPPNAPRPLTRAYIDSLCAQSPNIPPLTTQPSVIQQAYSSQEIYVEFSRVAGAPSTVIGAPLDIPFVALWDRPPRQGESDIILRVQDFQGMTHRLV
ncbi:hypothetical protein PENDEC_c001G03381 [Penicillium decumbens]|uniref:Restriction endonuclease domain-containing protein n=1 Tax=Penicillium decumbens TaxID=69771 RepID=A0A1V6PMI7_PENDC|nr:hypothetical protein PENDEC_c001G03381 [Penicillium decumbens]